jgi:V/A-type H+-transporting ATPase subunit D
VSDQMQTEFKPTRSALLDVRKRVRFSRKGYRILKMKRDGLVIELFKLLDQARDSRARLVEKYRAASKRLAVAQSVEGALGVRSAAFALASPPELRVKYRNVMGITLPRFDVAGIRKRMDQRGYGVIGMSEHIDEAVEAYEDLLLEIVRTAQVETSLRNVMDEIEVTKRRVNALEFKIIPELERSESMIRQRLEELERENTFRLKRFKGEG